MRKLLVNSGFKRHNMITRKLWSRSVLEERQSLRVTANR